MDGNAGRPTAGDRARRRVGLRVGYLTVNAGPVLAAGGVQGSGWRPAGWRLGPVVHTGHVLFGAGRLRQRPVEREPARERVR